MIVDVLDLSTVQADPLAAFRRLPDDRCDREHRRTPEEVPWLSSVKLSWGLEVSLLNISSTGMLVETTSKFAPGSVTEFELSGPDSSLVVPARFVRSEVAAADPLCVKYHAAVVFAKKVNFPELVGLAGGSSPKALADLLTYVVTDHRGAQPASLRARFEQGLLKLVSARQIRITDVPTRPPVGTESMCFAVPSPAGSSSILQVTFDPDYELGQLEFRFLRAAAALAGVILEMERMG
jgi:hypothetical protein